MSDGLLRRAGHPRARRQPRRRLAAGTARRPARCSAGIEKLLLARAARLGAGLRRHQLHAGRGAGRGQAAHPGGPRGGRPAQLQPPHARGDQPGARRPPVRPAVLPQPDGGRTTWPPRASATACIWSATSWPMRCASPGSADAADPTILAQLGPDARGATSWPPSTAPRTPTIPAAWRAHPGRPGAAGRGPVVFPCTRGPGSGWHGLSGRCPPAAVRCSSRVGYSTCCGWSSSAR